MQDSEQMCQSWKAKNDDAKQREELGVQYIKMNKKLRQNVEDLSESIQVVFKKNEELRKKELVTSQSVGSMFEH